MIGEKIILQKPDLQFSVVNSINNDDKTILISDNTEVWTRINLAGSGTTEQMGIFDDYFTIKFKVISGLYKNYVIAHTYYLRRSSSGYQNTNPKLIEKNALVCAVIESINEALKSDESLILTQILQSTNLQHYNNTVCRVKIGIYDNPSGARFNRNIVIAVL